MDSRNPLVLTAISESLPVATRGIQASVCAVNLLPFRVVSYVFPEKEYSWTPDVATSSIIRFILRIKTT